MHWFWRAAIAVIVGNIAGVVGLYLCIGVFARLLKSIGIANPTPLSFLFIYSFISVTVLGVCEFLLRPETSDELLSETRCRKCQYILRGISEPRCPECGERI